MGAKTKQYILDQVEEFLVKHPEKRLQRKTKVKRYHPVNYYCSLGQINRFTSPLPPQSLGVSKAVGALGSHGVVTDPSIEHQAPKLGIVYPPKRGKDRPPISFYNRHKEKGTLRNPSYADSKILMDTEGLPYAEDIQVVPGLGKGGGFNE